MKNFKFILVFTILFFIINLFAQPYAVSVRFVDSLTGLDYTDITSIQFEVELEQGSGDIQVGPSGLCFVEIADIGTGMQNSYISFDLANFSNTYTPTSDVRVTIWDGSNLEGAGEIIYNVAEDLDPANGFMGWEEWFGAGGNPLVVEPDALPVILSDFTTAVFANEFVEISWTTQSCTNMSLWNLYRQDPGTTEQILIHTTEAINSTEPQDYNFEDYYVENDQTYYYYLESIEYDGTSQMYGPVSATMEGGLIPELPTETILNGIYPNPFN